MNDNVFDIDRGRIWFDTLRWLLALDHAAFECMYPARVPRGLRPLLEEVDYLTFLGGLKQIGELRGLLGESVFGQEPGLFVPLFDVILLVLSHCSLMIDFRCTMLQQLG